MSGLTWKEIAMYGTIGILVISAGALKVVDQAQAGAALTALVTFIIGRRIPYTSKDDKEDK